MNGLPDISILVPTRERPDNLTRLYASVMARASEPMKIEVVAYVDEDDATYDGISMPRLTIVRGPQLLLAEAWNECWYNSVGDWLGLFGDDVTFNTDEWDKKLHERTDQYPDHIGWFYGDDLSNEGKSYGTHGFIHKDWAETVGYFVPPYFAAGYVDTWLNEVAHQIDRHILLDIVTEHLHAGMGKAENDQVYERATPKTEQAGLLYHTREKEFERAADAAALKNLIDKYIQSKKG